MGRKKRPKTEEADVLEDSKEVPLPPPLPGVSPPPLPLPTNVPPPPPAVALPQPPPTDPRGRAKFEGSNNHAAFQDNADVDADTDEAEKKVSSGYAMTEHSAEIIDEDIYISDGSESEDELAMETDMDITGEDDADRPRGIELVLNNSRMGIMRRGMGMMNPSMLQPNRQWSRNDTNADEVVGEGGGGEDKEDQEAAEQRRLKEEEELAKLDPAQRAARLLAEKQRKLEEAKITARRLASEENAGRDPALFSKRTAFDIKFDQIDDKPWTRSNNMEDFFNYGFSEEEWLEYSQQQLAIKKELVDASRQKRLPDPAIVPVIPRVPKKPVSMETLDGQAGKNDNTTDPSSAANGADGADKDEAEGGDGDSPMVGPVFVKDQDKRKEQPTSTDSAVGQLGPTKNENRQFVDIDVGEGGAWGAGAPPGSLLAKLIEEQEKLQEQQSQPPPPPPPPKHGDVHITNDGYHDDGGYSHEYDQHHPPPGPPRGPEGPPMQRVEWDNHQGGFPNNEWESHQGFRNNGFQGGRGGFRGGRGGRGGHFSDNFGGRGGRGWGGRGGDDFRSRKRPRDDYDDRYRH